MRARRKRIEIIVVGSGWRDTSDGDLNDAEVNKRTMKSTTISENMQLNSNNLFFILFF